MSCPVSNNKSLINQRWYIINDMPGFNILWISISNPSTFRGNTLEAFAHCDVFMVVYGDTAEEILEISTGYWSFTPVDDGADFAILLDITGSNEITVRRGMNFLSENVGRHPISVVGKVFVLHCTMRRVALYPSVTPDKIAEMLRISDSEILRLPLWLVSYHDYLSDWCHISPLGPK